MKAKFTNKILINILELGETDKWRNSHPYTTPITYLADKFDIKTHWMCLQGAWHEVGCQCGKALKTITTTT